MTVCFQRLLVVFVNQVASQKSLVCAHRFEESLLLTNCLSSQLILLTLDSSKSIHSDSTFWLYFSNLNNGTAIRPFDKAITVIDVSQFCSTM